MTPPDDDRALERELRRLEGSVRELEVRHEQRVRNRDALRTRPSVEKRTPKAERPRCGARCRAWELTAEGWRRIPTDKRCQAPVLVTREPDGSVKQHKVCRMHGANGGPKTPEGRARCAEGGRRGAAERWRRARAAKAAEGTGT